MGIAIVDVFSARANSSQDVEIAEVSGLPTFDVSVSYLPNSEKTHVLRAFEQVLQDTSSALT